MDEQFILRVPPFVAERLDRLLSENTSSFEDKSLDLMILVRESGEASPDVVEYRHGLTPPMRDARKRRFRMELDLNT
ncbi:hypothetical protein CRYUN_Cryun11dG0066600 [Craigia yunnanensis]